MSLEPKPSISPAKVRAICNRAGIVVLIVGLAAAAWIWRTQGSEDDDRANILAHGLSPDDSAKYQRQVEIDSGQVGVLVEKWTRQAAELSHGKALAESIALLSTAGAGSCFLVSFALRKVRRWPTREVN